MYQGNRDNAAIALFHQIQQSAAQNRVQVLFHLATFLLHATPTQLVDGQKAPSKATFWDDFSCSDVTKTSAWMTFTPAQIKYQAHYF